MKKAEGVFNEFKNCPNEMVGLVKGLNTEEIEGGRCMKGLHDYYESKLHDYSNSFIRKCDIICISETWLNASDNRELLKLFGYKMVHKYHTNKKGGGDAIYIAI